MQNTNLKKMTYTALFTALVFILTYTIKIPMPGGYINLGEGGIYICAVLCGPFAGAFAGGVGSALADLAGGYPYWILPTLIIKFVEGFVVGKFAQKSVGYVNKKNLLGMLIAGVFMICAYFVSRFIVLGSDVNSVPAALFAAGMNVFQITAGIVCTSIVLKALEKSGVKLSFDNGAKSAKAAKAAK